jgi:hypothetical protein
MPPENDFALKVSDGSTQVNFLNWRRDNFLPLWYPTFSRSVDFGVKTKLFPKNIFA